MSARVTQAWHSLSLECHLFKVAFIKEALARQTSFGVPLIWSGFHQSSRGVCFTMGVRQSSSMLLHRSVFHHSSMDFKSSSIAELLKWRRCMSLEWYGCAGVHSRRDGSIPRDYRQVSNIRRTKSQNLEVSRLALQLPLCNIWKPGLKPRMKM